MRYLFLDTETDRMWDSRLDARDPAQAVPVQIAAVLDDDGRTVSAMSSVVHPGTWAERLGRFDPGAVAVHGITEEVAKFYGQPAQLVWTQLMWMVSHADRIVAHNAEFDTNVLASAAGHLRLPAPFLPETRCTMILSTEVAGIPDGKSVSGRKWPKLGEAYFAVTRKTYAPRHDALYDVYACRSIWRELLARGAALA